jgi:hypothetical protein
VSAPDVVYVCRGLTGRGRRGVFDDTARSWDRRTAPTVGPAPDPAVTPLRHEDGCRMAPWPDLADVCPCTAQQRYQHRHVDAY